MNHEKEKETLENVGRQPISWTGHEYTHFEKGADWYWALGLIAIAGSVAAISFHNILFAILILIAAFVLAVFASKKPHKTHFTISQRGIRIDDTLFPFQTLKSFGIEDHLNHHSPKLIVESKKALVSNIIIPLQNVSVNEVHDFLQHYLVQEELHEPLIHKIMEWLGF